MTEYGIGFAPQHVELFVASAIAPAVVQARGYRSVTELAMLERAGFSRLQRRVPGLLIPVHDVVGTVRTFQYRPDAPRVTDGGKTVKYETRSGDRMVLDVPVDVRAQLGDIAVPLYVTEGARKADSAVSAGLCCVALLGVWSWRGTNPNGAKTALGDWEHVALDGRTVYVAFDSDVMVKPSVHRALERFGTFLAARGAHVAYVYLPAATNGTKTGLDDWLAAGHDAAELPTLASVELRPADADGITGEARSGQTAPAVEPCALDDAIVTFGRWLYFDDVGLLEIVLAALVANLLPGDPVWLLLIGAPSSGKTEVANTARGLGFVHPISTITPAALLSGSARKDRGAHATGGLLHAVGDFGILLAKDFTSILAMPNESRSVALAALREVYDGSYDRAVGVDGGQTLSWAGKAGLVACSTPTIDAYHSVLNAMGNRFVFYRVDVGDQDAHADFALASIGRETEMRAELAAATAGVVAGLEIPERIAAHDVETQRRIRALAAFATKARTAVERDRYHHDVELVPVAEGPGRLVKQFAQLLHAFDLLGVERARAFALLGKLALDAIPAVRRTVLEPLIATPDELQTSAVMRACRLPKTTTERALEDCFLLELVRRRKDGAHDTAPWCWTASAWTRDTYPRGLST